MQNENKVNNGSLSENAIKILEKRYFLRNDKNEIVEDWDKLCRRVAKFVASGENTKELQKEWEDKFYEMIFNLEFLPSSPTLFNAGTKDPQLNACFVIYPDDSMESIFKAVADSAMIYKSGGGCGFYFGNLRPRNSLVGGTGGIASGPLSFMEVFDKTVEVVKQGSKRRGAALGCLPIWHLDIEEFIKCKADKKSFTNFNISVGITDEFMKAVENDKEFELKHPKTNITKKVNAKKLWHTIIKQAHKTGDPGVLFIDNINKYNPLCNDKIQCTNPCVTGDTLVATPDGYRYARDLKINDRISTVCGSGYIKTMEINDNYPVYEIELSDGGIIKVTESHQFHALKSIGKGNKIKKYELLKLKELRVKDWIRVNKTNLPNTNFKNKYNITDVEFGFIIGLLIGDGSITQKMINNKVIKISSNQDENNWNDNIKILLKKLGCKYNIEEDKKSRSLTFTINGDSILLKLVKEYNLMGDCYTKRIPYVLFQTNKDVLSGILNGLFSSDGNINLSGTHPAIRYSSCNRMLIKDIRDIILMFDMHCSMYTSSGSRDSIINGRKIIGNTKYELIISGHSIKTFYDNIELSHPEKQRKLFIAIKDYALTGNIWRASIKSIKLLDKKETVYDFFEENTDTWITNGYVSRGCGEVPLESYESCVLGSVNLVKFIKNDEVDYLRLKEIVARGTRFLDNTIDLNKYPIPEIEKASKLNRKIGLGIMGYADILLQLGIKYDSNESYKFADQLMNVINKESFFTSAKLGEEKGNFPNFENSIFNGKNKTFKKSRFLRNATRTTIAPTGTISVIAGVSSGMEPIFAFEYDRESSEGVKLDWIHPLYKKIKDENGGKIPDKYKKIFITAKDIEPDWHLKIQQAFQLHIDNSISKTINMPFRSTVKEIKKIYEKAFTLGLKGVTVFRDGCRGKQVLYDKKLQCPSCKKFTLEVNEGCSTCRSCGYSACSINKGK